MRMYLVKIREHNSSILDAKPEEAGFWVGKNMEFAAIPLSGSKTKLVVFHNGKQQKVCRNRLSAINYIQKQLKGVPSKVS